MRHAVIVALLQIGLCGTAYPEGGWMEVEQPPLAASWSSMVPPGSPYCDAAVRFADADGRPVPNRCAVVIGLDAYDRDTAPSLRSSANDARSFVDFLLRQGYALNDIGVYILPDAQEGAPRFVNTLTASGRRSSNLAADLGKWLHRKIDSSSHVTFYYSGHGWADSTDQYLVTPNGDPSSPFGNVPMGAIERKLCSADEAVIIVDACRNGVETETDEAANSRLARLAAMRASPLRLLELRACSPGESASEVPDWPNSLFTHFLMLGLEGAADGNGGTPDGMVTTPELCQYLSAALPEWTRANRCAPQTPWVLQAHVQLRHPLAYCAPEGRVATELVRQACDASAQDDWTRALKLSVNALRCFPRHAEAQTSVTRCLIQLCPEPYRDGSPDSYWVAAFACLDYLAADEPIWLWSAPLAVCLRLQGQNELAYQWLEEAAPGVEEHHRGLGILLRWIPEAYRLLGAEPARRVSQVYAEQLEREPGVVRRLVYLALVEDYVTRRGPQQASRGDISEVIRRCQDSGGVVPRAWLPVPRLIVVKPAGDAASADGLLYQEISARWDDQVASLEADTLSLAQWLGKSTQGLPQFAPIRTVLQTMKVPAQYELAHQADYDDARIYVFTQ